MNYSIKFYPEKRKGIDKNVPIMLSVSFSGTRMFYYTGERCDVNQWDYSSSRMKRNNVSPSGKTTTLFNAALDKIKVAVDDLFKVYDLSEDTPTPSQLRDDLKARLNKRNKKAESTGLIERFEKYIRDAALSAGRKKHLTTTLNKVKAFSPGITYQKMNIQYLVDFQNYLKQDCKLGKNTVISEMKRLRSFISYSKKMSWTTLDPFENFTIEAESYGDPVFITTQERDLLFNAEISEAYLSRVRDIFVFQCFIGCRIGDLVKLKKSNIIDGCLEYIAGKTKENKPRIARIPLTEKALSILSKYDLPEGDLLPYISSQRYNDYIRKLFKKLELNRMVTIVDPKTRNNVQKPISEIASSHMARRVFIGNLHHRGVKNEVIGSMSGHAENSRAFNRYYAIDVEDQKSAVKLIE